MYIVHMCVGIYIYIYIYIYYVHSICLVLGGFVSCFLKIILLFGFLDVCFFFVFFFHL